MHLPLRLNLLSLLSAHALAYTHAYAVGHADAGCHTLRMTRIMACQTPEDAEVQDAALFKKRSKGEYRPAKTVKDNRDNLLYRVTEVTPPPRRLGMFNLGE